MEFCECRSNEAILVSIDANKKIDVTSNFNKIPELTNYIRAVLIVNINNKLNYNTIDVTTPLMSLYSGLNIFWQNYLNQYEASRSKGQDAIDTAIKYLGSNLKIHEKDGELDLTQVKSIFTFNDEITFWNQVLEKYPASDVYQDIAARFKVLDERLKEANTNTSISVDIEIIDTTYDILNNLNNHTEQNYPNLRKIAIIDILSYWLIQRESYYFNDFSLNLKTKRRRGDNINWVWDSLFVEAKHHIRKLYSSLTHFEDNLTKYLVTIDYLREEIDLNRFEKFKERIYEIQEIRSQHDLMLSILGYNSADKEQLSKTLEIFCKIKYLNTADLHDRWDEAKKKYNGYISQFLKKSSQKLRYNLFDDSRAIATKISSYERFQHLLKIEFIAIEFAKDREKLCKDIASYADSLKDEVESLLGMKLENEDLSSNLQYIECASKYLNQLAQVRNYYTATKRLETFCLSYMADIDSGIKAKDTIQKIRADFKNYEEEIFADWNQWVVNEPDFDLKLGEQLLHFEESTGRLQLRYSDKIVLLIRDSKLLGEMGYKLDADVTKTIEVGTKFYKYAVSLRQIVEYYNSWGNRVPAVQKPLVLDAALEFEKEIVKIKEQKITWNNSTVLANYVDILHQKYLKITVATKSVQDFHTKIITICKDAFKLRPMRDWRKFLELVNKIQGEFDQLKNYHQEKFLIPYMEFIDCQLYKALNAQMKQDISITELIGEKSIKLNLNENKLDYLPSKFDIVNDIYEGYSNYLEQVDSFKGISGKVSFEPLVRKYSNLANTYNVILEAVKHLSAGAQNYKKYVTQMESLNLLLESGQMDEFVDQCGEVQSTVLRLPDYEIIQNFRVDIHSFKTSLDVRLKSMSAQITGKIREKIELFVSKTDVFISKTNEVINKKPESFEEITTSKMEIGGVNEDLKSIKTEYDNVVSLNEVYRKITNEYVKIEDFKVRLTNLFESVKDFDGKIDEQKNYVKQLLLEKAENLIKKFEKFSAKFATTKPKKDEFTDMFVVYNIYSEVLAQKEGYESVKKEIEQIYVESRNFEMELHSFPKYEESKAELDDYFGAWNMFNEIWEKMQSFFDDLWLEFPARYGEFEDSISAWLNNITSSGRTDTVSKFLLAELNRYKLCLPVFKYMNAECYEQEHWASLMYSILRIEKNITIKTLKFQHIAEKLGNVNEQVNKIKELYARAYGEQQIRESISDIKSWFEVTEFNFYSYKCESGTFNLIKEWKDLTLQISDNISLLGSVKDSKFFQKYAENINLYDSRMVQLDYAIGKLSILQRKWIYLEPIFARKSLPQEEERFEMVDKEFREYYEYLYSNKRVGALLDMPNIGTNLERLIEQLERCQKALNDFLEEKRSKFPRFYFIGDEDLLEILGQSRNQTVILAHIRKLYYGINYITSDDNFTKIQTINSAQDESVALVEPVAVTQVVEDWLNKLTNAMKDTLGAQLKELISNDLDINKYPAQVLMLSEMLNFNQTVQKSIKGNKLISLKEDQAAKLDSFTKFRDQGSLLDKLKLKSLILDLIHNIAVVDDLIECRVNSLDSWGYLRLIKYEMQGNLKVKMVDAIFDYTFEYQGNESKLVHTPLTDKCYLTLTQGMKMGYGGNPYGPAGTGKTESVKALGSFMGRLVLVFNCDEAIDYRSIGRIFIGIIKSGSWGCFDEFNRLLEEQLSAISQQIQTIQAAIKEKKNTAEILGKVSHLDFNSGIFVTLNPAGKGYGARSKLPDNLKMLFRPVAMSIPDSILISETLLYAEGFRSAKELSVKIVSLFSLSKQMLSDQKHYDWGLRALKTCLNSGGNMLTGQINEHGSDYNMTTEYEIIIKSLRINTCPKLTSDDCVRYDNLLQDIFPEYDIKDFEMKDLEEKLKETIEQRGLEYSQMQIKKIIQFYESTFQRIGVCLVGPSGSGKSTIWNLCKSALEKLGKTVKTFPLNPKAISKSLLLGDYDQETREFKDGVLTACSRKVAAEHKDTLCWIVCDGDIDPKWVESLNSVLDDNKLLTLPNGERIQFGSNVNFLFETHVLKYASPATVSRVAVIYLNEQDFDVDNYLKYRFRNMKNYDKAHGLISEYFQEMLRIGQSVRAHQEVIENTQLGFINNLINLLKLSEDMMITDKQEFLCALINGVTQNLKAKGQQGGLEFIKKYFGGQISNKSDKLLSMKVVNGAWTEYKQYSPSEGDYNKLLDKQIMVGLPSQLKSMDMVKTLINNCENIIFTGQPGTGKSMIVNNVLNSVRNASVLHISCNASTTALDLIRRLQAQSLVVNSVNGKMYKPKEGSRFIIYLQNLNIIDPDIYETIGLVEFLLQILTYKGFYDENLEFVQIEKIQMIITMQNPTLRGRNTLSTRFTSRMQLVVMEEPTFEECSYLYYVMVQAVVSANKEMSSQNLPTVGKALGAIQKHLKDKLSHEDYPYYDFTMRQFCNIILALRKHTISSMNDLVYALVFEVDRHIHDRLVGESHKTELDNCLFQALSKVVSVAPAVRKTLWKFAIVENGEYYLQGDKAADFNNMITSQLRLFEREYYEMRGLHLEEEEYLHNFLKIECQMLKPKGNTTILSRPGTGFYEAIIMVAFYLKYELVKPQITFNYNFKTFIREIKSILNKVLVDKVSVLYLVEDYKMINKDSIYYINSLMEGVDPWLIFTKEELEPIKTNLADQMKETSLSLEKLIQKLCSERLKIIMVIDYTNPNRTNMFLKNPGFVCCSQVIQIQEWSNNLYTNVSLKKLKDKVPKYADLAPKLSKAICSLINSQDKFPLALERMLENYVYVLNKFDKQFNDQLEYYKLGLSKLKSAEDKVNYMAENAAKKKEELTTKQEECSRVMKQISAACEKAADRKQNASRLEGELEIKGGDMAKKKAMIEGELSEVQPMIDAAKKKVGNIKYQDMNEIKNYKIMPVEIKDVITVIMMFFKEYDNGLTNMKRFLGNRGVINEIVSFEPLLEETELFKIDDFMYKNQRSFDKEVIQQKSSACVSLCEWAVSSIRYAKVIGKIQPLREELEKTENGLELSKISIIKCKQELEEIDKIVKNLTNTYEEKVQEASMLKANLEREEKVVFSAQNLIGKLIGERSRWGVLAKFLEKTISQLPQRSIVASGFLTFLGKEGENVRNNLLNKWHEVMKIEPSEMLKFLSDETNNLTYKNQGISGDNLSIENVVNLVNNKSLSFIIDPNNNCLNWLQKYLDADGKTYEITSQTDEKFMTKLELAIRFGRTLLINEMNSIPEVLYPLIKNEILVNGPRKTIHINDKQLDYNDQFCLYMITRDDTLHLDPICSAYLNVLSFSVTSSGLEDQLLSITIDIEQPELERRKQELIEGENNLKIKLNELEKSLLTQLAQDDSDILENKELIANLDLTKSKTLEINNSLEESKKLTADIEVQRSNYKNLSIIGSRIYLASKELINLNHMYQFGLNQYFSLYKKVIKGYDTSQGTELKLKISTLVKSLILESWFYFSRTLFKGDRLAFGLLYVNKVNPKTLPDNCYQLILGKLTPVDTGENSYPDWLPHEKKEDFNYMLNCMPELKNEINFKTHEWREWYHSQDFNYLVPLGNEKIAWKTKMIVIKYIKPDLFTNAVARFVGDFLKVSNIQPSNQSVDRIIKSNNSNSTVLIITSAGSDPTTEIEEAANKFGANFEYVALGGGQSIIAVEKLESSMRNGNWLFLKNIHLGISYLSKIESKLINSECHSNFKLFLTSESHPKFPSTLLQTCLKFSFESPPGIKYNVQSTWQNLSKSFIENSSSSKIKMVFNLSLFHALVQERRNYIPQGWVKFYEFSYADLMAGLEILNVHNNDKNTDFELIRGLFLNAIYGGRVDNDFDVMVLDEYLKLAFNNSSETKIDLIPYLSPPDNNVTSVMKQIQGLKEYDAPETFGLPADVEKNIMRFKTSLVISQMKSMHSQIESNLNKMEIAKTIFEFWSNLVKKAEKYDGKSEITNVPMDNWVSIEVERIYKLVRLVSETVKSLVAHSKGSANIDNSKIKEYEKLYLGDTPDQWLSIYEGPDNNTKFMNKLINITTNLNELRRQITGPDFMAELLQLDIENLMSSTSLINALKQTYARRAKVPLSSVKISFYSSFQAMKIRFKRLYINGCAIDRDYILTPKQQNQPDIIPVDDVYLYFSEQDPLSGETDYINVPVYENEKREDLVMSLKVKGHGELNQYVLSGTACFVSVDLV